MQENLRLKQELKERKEREIEIQKHINLERKFNLKNKIEQKKEEKYRQLNEEFKLLKIQKEYNRELRNYIKAEEQNLNKTRCENIRNQLGVLDEKKKAYEVNILFVIYNFYINFVSFNFIFFNLITNLANSKN